MARGTRLFILLLALALLLLVPAAAQAEGFVNTQSWSTYDNTAGQIMTGAGLTVHNGRLYVCDYGNGRVQVFTTDGAYVRQWAATSPTGIIVNPVNERVYVASASDVVKVYSLAGDSLGSLTTSGSGVGQTGAQYGIAVDASGNMYVSDSGNDRVEVYSAAGTFLREFGSSGTGDGQLGFPGGVAVDSTGNVYVFDWGLQRVSKFANDGTFLAKWGSTGTAAGSFSDALMLAVGPDDHVYVGDRGNDRIQEFTGDGAYVRSITATGLTQPLGVTLSPGKTLYAARNDEGTQIFRWDWDDTAPVITHDYDGEWHSIPFTITFSAKDDYTGVPWLRWRPEGGDWTNDGKVVVPVDRVTHGYDGYWRLQIGAGDSVSNWAYKSLTVKIDTRAPITHVAGVPAGWTNQDVTLSLSATDVGSGVHRTFYDLDGAGTTELAADGDLTISDPGVHTVSYFSQDNCPDMPNEEAAKQVQVLIDKMGPDAVPMNNVTVRFGARATFKYQLADDYSPTSTVNLVIKKKTKTVKIVKLGMKDSTLMVPAHQYSKRLAVTLARGTYTWTVVATDLAGNLGSYAPKKLVVK